jgi:VWFA-related protein
MSPGRVALLISLLAVITPRIAAQQPPELAAGSGQSQTSTAAQDPSGPIMTLHATARLVVLDVVVNDGHGHPVKGLKQSDFNLSEDGVPQHILSFTEHDISTDLPHTQPAPEADLPPNTFAGHSPITGEAAKTVIVLGNLSFANAPFARDELRAFLKTLTPGVPIAIFRIDWQGLHLVQSLTADPKVLQESAASKRILPPLGFPVRYFHRIGSPTQQLASYLANIPGRINLVWFGDGGVPSGHNDGLFPDLATGVPPDLAAFVQTMNNAPNVLRLSRIALYPIDAGGLVGDFGPAPDLLAAAGGSGGAMDAFTAGGSMGACQGLMAMAISAGGKAYCNTNGFKEALADVIATGSSYYTISYNPTNPNWNGAFRRIKIDAGPVLEESAFERFFDWLNQTPRVIYRDGYFARDRPERPPNLPEMAGNAVQGTGQQRKLISYSAKGDPGSWGSVGANTSMQTAMAFGMPTPFQIPFKVTVTPSAEIEKIHPGAQLLKGNYLSAPWRDQPYRNYKVHYSINPKDLQLDSTGFDYRDSLEIAAVVYRDDGPVVNSIAYTTEIQINAANLDRTARTGVTFDQTIAIPLAGNPLPGNFFLRVGVHELSTGRIGTIEVPAEWIKPLPPGAPAAVSAAR